MAKMKIGVIGGGISGLAAAYRLRQAGHDVMVMEAGDNVGGKVHSEQVDGFVVEHGPNGYLSSRLPQARLIKDLGLEAEIQPAEAAAKQRYLFMRGALRAVPSDLKALLKTDVISTRGRIQMAFEPLIPKLKENIDESVYGFAARRFGEEAAELLVDPMITGIYAGNARSLSLRAASPTLHAFEQRNGSVLRGAIAKKLRGESGARGHLTSLKGGMSTLIEALHRFLGDDAVLVNHPIRRVRQMPRGWRVFSKGNAPQTFDSLVFATPTYVTAELLASHAPDIVEPLEAIEYAPVGVVALGFREGTLPRALDGFGYLIPSSEQRKILGVLWPSTIFNGRAPAGFELIRTMVGGAWNPEALDQSDEDLKQMVLSELSATLGGPMPDPVFSRIIRWPQGIPQYTIGHLDRVAAAEAAVAQLPNVHLAGNGLYGVSTSDCAARAEELPGLV